MYSAVYMLLNIGTILPVWLMSHYNFRGIQITARYWRAVALVSLPFIVWDVFATQAGHWQFSERYTYGVSIAGLPVEEVLFFLTVPYACLFVWFVLKNRVRLRHTNILLARVLPLLLVLLALIVAHAGGNYSLIVTSVFLLALVILLRRDWLSDNRFWLYQIVLLGLFVAFNSVLTSLPVVSYGPDYITEYRIGTIPVEDFFYNFALINLFNLAYDTKLSFPKLLRRR